ncbi:unnamed protein product, partial [Durusdinium trenchii]
NSDDHVAQLLILATQWQKDPHLQETAAVPIAKSKELLDLLRRREFCEVRADIASSTLDLTVHLLMQRTWSLSRASAPPDCYAELLHPDVDKQQAAARLLKRDHIAVLQLEQCAADSGRTVQLLEDLRQVFTPPVKLMMQAFEEDFYRCDSPAGRHWLCGLLRTLPDNKLIEDLHGVLRNDAKSQKTRRQTLHHIMELVTQSKQLSSRKIVHKPMVDRAVFLQEFPRTPDKARKRRYWARHHKLAKHWSTIMGRKHWSTLSEDMLHRGFAALAFLRHYTAEGMGREGIPMSRGLLSKFAVELHVLKHIPSDYIGFCLGNACWACLMWPLQEFWDEDSDFTGYYLSPTGEAHWKFLVNPLDWLVVSFQAELFNDQIFMVPQGKETLLRFFFADVALHKNVTVADLMVLSRFLDLSEETKRLKRADLIHKLVDEIGGQDQDFISKIKADMAKPEKNEKLIGDELDEFVLAELPAEDQDEFRLVAKEVDSRKKAGWSLVECQWKKAMAKKKAKAKPKGKAKAKPKAKAKCGFARRSRKRKASEMEQAVT